MLREHYGRDEERLGLAALELGRERSFDQVLRALDVFSDSSTTEEVIVVPSVHCNAVACGGRWLNDQTFSV